MWSVLIVGRISSLIWKIGQWERASKGTMFLFFSSCVGYAMNQLSVLKKETKISNGLNQQIPRI